MIAFPFVPLSAESGDDRLIAACQALEPLYAGLAEFYAACHDPQSGGFFESPEDRKPGATPRLESTARALNALEQLELIAGMPREDLGKTVDFLQAFQDPATGFFDDRQEKRPIDMRRGRALSYAVRALTLLGQTPLHPVPGSTGNDSAQVEAGIRHWASEAAFRQWMERLDKEFSGKSWTIGGTLQGQAGVLRGFPEQRRAEAAAWVERYLAEIQDPATGMWWSGNPYVRLSGTFKLALFYRSFSLTMPNPEAIKASTLDCMRTQRAIDACFVRNPLELLEVIAPQVSLTAEERLESIRISHQNIKAFAREDGGFAKNQRRHSTTDGCSQAMKVRTMCWRLAAADAPGWPLRTPLPALFAGVR